MILVYLRRGAARNTFYLKRLGVTHVLNTAEGNRNGTVNTNQVISPPFKKKFVISFAKGLLLPVRHQVQGAEAAGRSSAEHFPAFPRGRRLHRRGPGWGGWGLFRSQKKTIFLTWTPQARCWWTARWECLGARLVFLPISSSDTRCLPTRPSTP